MVRLLMRLLFLALIASVIYWLITTVIPLPDPFRTIVLVIFGVLLIMILVSYPLGWSPGRWWIGP